MKKEYYDTYYDEEHGEERVVVDGQLYRVRDTKVGAPETNRFTATGSGSTSWTPIDEAGNPVPAKRWKDPGYVEGQISFLRENFECVRLLDEIGREAYPGAALKDFREHLKELHPDLAALDRMWREGDLDRLDAPIEGRLAALEKEDGLETGALRRGRRALPKRYEDLKKRITELSPVMRRYELMVPAVVDSGVDSDVTVR